jgi:DNA-directed RNA polymerase subunit RPC12/RpoP
MKLYCTRCGKTVSTEVPDNTLVRASLECPECSDRTRGPHQALAEKDKQIAELTQRAMGLEAISEKCLHLLDPAPDGRHSRMAEKLVPFLLYGGIPAEIKRLQGKGETGGTEMSEIKRYYPTLLARGAEVGMKESPTGCYVFFEDHQQALADVLRKHDLTKIRSGEVRGDARQAQRGRHRP